MLEYLYVRACCIADDVVNSIDIGCIQHRDPRSHQSRVNPLQGWLHRKPLGDFGHGNISEVVFNIFENLVNN